MPAARHLRLALLAGLAAGLLPGGAAAQGPAGWAAASRPTGGPARIAGGYGLGCIAGAVALPADGPGWQVVRLSRNRFWGHPQLVGYVRELAGRARSAGLPPLWIGDLGQPRGGPMPWGHASHQIGLDVDIWLDLNPKPALPPAARERIEVPSVVRPDGLAVDPARFTPAHATLIRLAAEHPAVDRIFVNPAIKQALCEVAPGASWLRRVRPWRGHDSHFHVRLRCPEGQPGCQPQAPVPQGDGCDASLAWWFTPEARQPPPRAHSPAPPPVLPAACAAVLSAP
ncbi:penicillin-insensitive murein endopeptidase [Pseudoroseomonas rhizosphaerae]|uniref:Penicillin-insensitive murein endopeptidase n=1 Tax=Teichococcus rhizosphaerae TaxID=1335062 RepID=A0A2C7A987_9PROT|nr:penicillin-insensitive murein endopeptidase [Pseudoroseomonas rhizosphaerae]